MEKTPYPFCHANSSNPGPFVLIHNDDPRFASLTIAAASRVRDNAQRK